MQSFYIDCAMCVAEIRSAFGWRCSQGPGKKQIKSMSRTCAGTHLANHVYRVSMHIHYISFGLDIFCSNLKAKLQANAMLVL